jgi:hypothetical protein
MGYDDDDDFDCCDNDFDEGWRNPGGRSDVIDCPYCGESIYHQAERCPHCERYVSPLEDPPARRQRPWWILIGALICLLIVVGWILNR